MGQRAVRDDRVTTHVALVARAFGAARIFMDEVNPEIRGTVERVNRSWGGSFEVRVIDGWRPLLLKKKAEGSRIVHLTMYGEPVNRAAGRLREERDLLVVVGAEKVPREVYGMAHWNVSVGAQPHSEVAALAVLLDRIQEGAQFSAEYAGARRAIVPQERGKRVVDAGGPDPGGPAAPLPGDPAPPRG